ncbi:hypothetical protein [Cytobacillus praedii]|uniref:hypothetical protein n=1 Tax=Cytobacillus praedii TaxID=1742358 RepID=UPI002E1CCAD9|nr:hypothetical protein [Cytobacillus praedii]
MKKALLILFSLLLLVSCSQENTRKIDKDISSGTEKESKPQLKQVFLIRSEIREKIDIILEIWDPVMIELNGSNYNSEIHSNILKQINVWARLDDLSEQEVKAVQQMYEIAENVGGFWPDINLAKEMNLTAAKMVYRQQVTELKTLYSTWEYN